MSGPHYGSGFDPIVSHANFRSEAANSAVGQGKALPGTAAVLTVLTLFFRAEFSRFSCTARRHEGERTLLRLFAASALTYSRSSAQNVIQSDGSPGRYGLLAGYRWDRMRTRGVYFQWLNTA